VKLSFIVAFLGLKENSGESTCKLGNSRFVSFPIHSAFTKMNLCLRETGKRKARVYGNYTDIMREDALYSATDWPEPSSCAELLFPHVNSVFLSIIDLFLISNILMPK
jgi:hypothetical protein